MINSKQVLVLSPLDGQVKEWWARLASSTSERYLVLPIQWEAGQTLPTLLLNLSGPLLSQNANQTPWSPIQGAPSVALPCLCLFPSVHTLLPNSPPLPTLTSVPTGDFHSFCQALLKFSLTRTSQTPLGGTLLSFLILLIILKPFKTLVLEYVMLARPSSNYSMSSLRVGVWLMHLCSSIHLVSHYSH